MPLHQRVYRSLDSLGIVACHPGSRDARFEDATARLLPPPRCVSLAAAGQRGRAPHFETALKWLLFSMPFTHGVLSSFSEQRTEVWACQDSPSNCPYRGESGQEAAGRLYRCLVFETPEAASEHLRGAVGFGSDISLLRGVLSTDPRALRGMPDSQVINRIAELVASRRLCLVAEVGVARQAGSGERATRPRSTAVTPSRLTERVGETTAPPLPAVSEFTDDVNQALQAAALEEAAETGVPFCEVCEKAKPQASESATT